MKRDLLHYLEQTFESCTDWPDSCSEPQFLVKWHFISLRKPVSAVNPVLWAWYLNHRAIWLMRMAVSAQIRVLPPIKPLNEALGIRIVVIYQIIILRTAIYLNCDRKGTYHAILPIIIHDCIAYRARSSPMATGV